MKKGRIVPWIYTLLLISGMIIFGCKKQESIHPNDLTYGQNAKGVIPSLLENKMMVGLSEAQGYTWMEESKVPWNSRYMYLANGWVDNWGWGDRNGNYAYNYMTQSEGMNAIPIFEWYPLTYLGEVSVNLTGKVADSDLMYEYFDQFKILLERAKEFDEPVIIAIEADGFAFLEIQSNEDPNTYAAVQASGMPELSALPNTIAGWGMAFLELKKKVGADKVLLGMHVSGWATGADIIYQSYNSNLAPAVNQVYKFLAPLGLADNQTGLNYNFLVGDPIDRDAGFYEVNYNQDRWLDMSSDASIKSKSFNRYAAWLKLWNEKAEMRWLLWQIPLGNKYHLNVKNNYGPQEGYKDNKVEYFLEDASMDNMAVYADCGVVGLLFGAGATWQSSYTNDYDDSGNLYMETKAGIFYNNGGMILKR